MPEDKMNPELSDDQSSSRRVQIRENMLRSIVTEPLLSQVRDKESASFDVIIALNELYKGGLSEALSLVRDLAKEWNISYSTVSNYVFATLTGVQILALARMTQEQVDASGFGGSEDHTSSTIYRIWEDTEVNLSLTRSLSSIKADAAQRAFRALGEGVTWAVLDSGIQGTHPHFQFSNNELGRVNSLELKQPLRHMDLTPLGRSKAFETLVDSGGTTSHIDIDYDFRQLNTAATALTDNLGHGTHVAGIIAGHWESQDPGGDLVAGTEELNEAQEDQPFLRRTKIRAISGVAPLARLLSLKVIPDETIGTKPAKQTAGQGKVSWILLAIDQIQQWNQYGKRLLVQGVNMSLGYDFDPRWFACGESPLCVEVNRLVNCGVVVVVSAGNGGFTSYLTKNAQPQSRYSSLSISDPGNADLAITVGSTHKEMPHRYGISYFSSRGPTGDGRPKPDLVAPGERIISCASGIELKRFAQTSDGGQLVPELLFIEQSGTSMAAPHVSGAIAAFLSVRSEFIGLPDRVKQVFMETAIDLRRERCFQGAGLIDLMKALQSV